MRQFQALGFSCTDLSHLNRVRLHQQVLFVSDIMDAGGKAIDRAYNEKREEGERWSSLLFPIERPRSSDFRLWRAALQQLRLGSGHSRPRLGEFLSAGHKIWRWRFDMETNQVFHLGKDGTMDIYTPSLVPRYTRRPNCWTRARVKVPAEDCTTICTMKEVGPAVWSICSYSQMAPVPTPSQTFWDVMLDWGYEWLWADLKVVGPTDWLAAAITTGSCIGVSDGSYMRESCKDICSAAFFFESMD